MKDYSQYEHPGKILENALTARELTQLKVSELSGVPQSHISAIINGKRFISAEQALRFGGSLDVDPDLFLEVQMLHKLCLAQEKHGAEILANVRPYTEK